jgi:ApaG protein
LSGFVVEVETRFIERESDPARDRYVFAYTITISNHGDTSGQLLNRHWFVTNAKNAVQEVQGAGVVGEQPRIEPGQSYRYTSAAVLETPVGAMHGHYQFRRDDESLFDVPIPAFSLSVPNMVH